MFIKAKLGNMRKEQEFTVYPQNDPEIVTVQSDKSIGQFFITGENKGKGLLNIKGSYFPHLSPNMGAISYTFPEDFVEKVIAAIPKKGQKVAPGLVIG